MTSPELRILFESTLESTGRDDARCFSADQIVQVGRHPENDLVVPSTRVSRFHLTLFCDGRTWHCASFGTNGTQSDGRCISHCEIGTGTVLELGPPGPRLRMEVVGGSSPDDEDAEALDDFRGTMTLLIDDMKAGDAESVAQLWAKCFATIVRLARQRLGSSRKRVEDEEDVASEVFENLYFASVEGKLPELTDRQSLWRLLVTMTRNAAIDSVNREECTKRGSGSVRGDSIADDAGLAALCAGPSVFDNFISQTPTPDVLVSLNEQVERWMARLPDDESRRIALLRLEGFGCSEIAEQLNLPQRTTERRLQEIRAAWDEQP